MVAKLEGATTPATPAYVGLSPRMQHTPYNSGKPGFLGPAYAPFQPNGDAKGDLVLSGLTLERLGDRGRLQAALDTFNRKVDATGLMDGMDTFQQQAFGVLTSSALADALDVSKEPQAVRDRYGYGTEKHQGDGAPRLMQQFLAARRLVEAGVRCVTLSFSFWDYHGGNRGRAAGSLRGNPRHALRSPRHRPPLDHPRSRRPAAIPDRPPRAAARTCVATAGLGGISAMPMNPHVVIPQRSSAHRVPIQTGSATGSRSGGACSHRA